MATDIEKAEALRGSTEAAIQRIRQNTDLRPEAAQRAMAKVYSEANTQMKAMEMSAAGNKATAVAKAKRDLFGIDDITRTMTPSEQVQAQMSFRDAQQRVGSISDASEAQRMLDSASQTGDEILARAIGNHALNSGMSTVAESYLGDRPNKVSAHQALSSLNPSLNAQTLFAFILNKPSELSRLGDSKIAEMANS